MSPQAISPRSFVKSRVRPTLNVSAIDPSLAGNGGH
jgi:hypothetical protein